ncbi:type III-B CRISPR module-associated protein Cmr5 [Kutzneria buriramensis]|uniref:CRISPR type III-B/RAMP module-associated protein Cmr5 n=1 Tax=Kutzneria buriramensis TaxID=1045776 RepID=A0A3E0HMW5_9PSEU|nr:type III-B CRISPR module-associated protein Cmr5 [Kutzneria buriramensis]REH47345.1 CRISPR type III-B/RAMP module-associated protein Cmr5 [Kutzneria buriramensis]
MTATRIDHELAKVAAKTVPGTVSDDLRTRYAGLPHMIMASGLAASVAFLLAKAESTAGGIDGPAYREAATTLLDDAADCAGIPRGEHPNATLTNIANADHHRYLIAESRARMLAVWLARIANARRGSTTGQVTGTGA